MYHDLLLLCLCRDTAAVLMKVLTARATQKVLMQLQVRSGHPAVGTDLHLFAFLQGSNNHRACQQCGGACVESFLRTAAVSEGFSHSSCQHRRS